MLGRLFVGPLAIVYWGIGLWGFVLTLRYVYDVFGMIGAVICFILGPLGFFFAPLHAGFVNGYWLPAMVSYAPMVLMLVIGIGASLLQRD